MRSLGEAAGPLEASVFVEGLRAIPAGFVAIGLIVHALVWAIATHFAEPSPSPEMAVALTLGREWLPGYAQLPPLSPWISAAVFHVTQSFFALRLLATLCVAAAGWIVFLLARRIVGDRHGAIAVLVMVAVFPVAFPGSTPNGDLLQVPLAAAAILFWWIAVGERNPNGWMLLGATLGAMVYGGPQALVLLAVFVIVTLVSGRFRAAVARTDALLCIGVALLVFVFVAGPRAIWLWHYGQADFFAGLPAGIALKEMLSPLRLAVTLLIGHFGFAFLLFLATAYATKTKDNEPVFVRDPVPLSFRRGVLILAVAPVVVALLGLYAMNLPAKPQSFAPLLMLSGLAAVLMGSERLVGRRQRMVGLIALIFLFVPAVTQLVLSFVPGWLGENRATNWPASATARTLTEIYHTRTGRPLAFVVGERVQAAQISVLSSDRPQILIDADRALSPWIDDAEFKKKGGVVFWEIRGADQSPPADYVKRLPAFVEEAPLRLQWARGGGDPVRLGWAIVPPQP